MKLKKIMTIGGVAIMSNEDGTYVQFVSDLDVCTDGTGDDHGDDYHQDETAYYNGGKFLNADVDQYIVIPPQIRSCVPPVVMGCQARATNLKTAKVFDAVTGEIGPDDKTGEAAYCLAKKLNHTVSANCGDSDKHYLYELFPGRAAVVSGKHYKLEPA